MLELLWLIVDNSCEKAGTFVEGAENLKLFFAKSPVDVALAVETNWKKERNKNDRFLYDQDEN